MGKKCTQSWRHATPRRTVSVVNARGPNDALGHRGSLPVHHYYSSINALTCMNTYRGSPDHDHLSHQIKTIRPKNEMRLGSEELRRRQREQRRGGKGRHTEEKRHKLTRVVIGGSAWDRVDIRVQGGCRATEFAPSGPVRPAACGVRSRCDASAVISPAPLCPTQLCAIPFSPTIPAPNTHRLASLVVCQEKSIPCINN